MNDESNLVEKIIWKIFAIVLFVGFMVYLYWLGIKGMLGLLTGMTLAFLLIITKNPLLLFFVRKTDGGEAYLNMLLEKKK